MAVMWRHHHSDVGISPHRFVVRYALGTVVTVVKSSTSGAELTREARNRLTLAELGIRPHDKILEIGCGNGVGVRLATDMAPHGFVAAIDVAHERTKKARRLNA